jgi:hypothetical protein
MWTLLFAVAIVILLYWAGRFILSLSIGIPMVITEKIQDYRKGLLDAKEIRLWKVAFVLWILVFLLVGFGMMVYYSSHAN